MKKNIFAVCDLEADYAYNFMDYLNRKKNIPFEIQVFTSAETLLSFAGDRHIELLLISDKAMCPKIRELYQDYKMIEVDRQDNLVTKSHVGRYKELIIKNY